MFFYSPLHPFFPGIISRSGEIPVSELVEEISEVFRCCNRRFFRVSTFINPTVDFQTVSSTGFVNELPRSAGLRRRISLRVKTTFDHGKIHKVLGHTVLSQDIRNDRHISSGPSQPVCENLSFFISKIPYVVFHGVIKHDGYVKILNIGASDERFNIVIIQKNFFPFDNRRLVNRQIELRRFFLRRKFKCRTQLPSFGLSDCLSPGRRPDLIFSRNSRLLRIVLRIQGLAV